MSVESSILLLQIPVSSTKPLRMLWYTFDYRVFMAAHDAEAIDVLKDAHVDLILADVENRDCDIVQFWHGCVSPIQDLVRVLLVGEEANIKLSDALARTAAYQYLTKPLLAEQTCLVVKRALETRELARRHRHLVRELKIGEDSHFSAWQAGYPDEGRSLAFRTSRLCERGNVRTLRSRPRGGAHRSADPDRGGNRDRQRIARACLAFPFAPFVEPLDGGRTAAVCAMNFYIPNSSATNAVLSPAPSVIAWGCSGPPTAGRSFSTKFPRSRRRFRSAFCDFCKKAR